MGRPRMEGEQVPNPIKYNSDRQTIDQDITDLIQTWETATISSDAITFSGSSMTVDTQGSAATDDLKTITPGNAPTGFVLMLRSTSEARVITLKHNTGNLWLGGADVVLETPRRMVMLIYDGAYWVLIGGAGMGATEVEVTPDGGEDLLCVIAARLVEYVDYIMTQAADARAGGLIAVTAAITAAIHLAEPNADQNLINALALAIVEEYADDTEINAAFTTTVYGNLQCSLYCGNSSGDGRFYASDIPILIAYLAAFAGVPYDLLEDIVTILGADGLTRAVGLSILTASTADCSGDCPCSIEFEWESASASIQKGCTVTVNVVLTIKGSGTLPSDIDVDITTAGTGTGGGTDYTLNTTTVTFTAGSGDGDTQPVEVVIASGATTNDTVILGLDPDSGEVGDVATHTITIIAATGGDITYDFTTAEYNASTDTEGTAWVSGEGWKKAAGSASGTVGNRVILPVQIAVAPPGTQMSIYVLTQSDGNTSVNFGFEGAVARRVDNTGAMNSPGQWHGPFTLFGGTGQNLTCWLQHADTVTTWIKAMRIATDGLICGP